MIADDLFALGLTPDEVFALPVCDDAERVETIASALGWLFASERVGFAHGMVFHQLDATTRKTATTYFDLLLSRQAWFEVLPHPQCSVYRSCSDRACHHERVDRVPRPACVVCGVSAQASAGEERRLGLARITHIPSMLLI